MSADSTPANQSKLWGGRFDRPPNELFYEFQRSFPFDRRLLPYELAVDRAWAQGLRRAGILTAPECERTLAALDEICRRTTDPEVVRGGLNELSWGLLDATLHAVPGRVLGRAAALSGPYSKVRARRRLAQASRP